MRRRLLTAILTVPLLLARASADDPAVRRRAKEMNVRCAAALDRGANEEALRCFEQVYRLLPSANLFFNIGLALDRLGRTLEARDAFSRFLAESPSAPADRLQLARERVAALSALEGRLAVTSTTGGASVSIDGRVVGTIPLREPARVLAGTHEVRVEAPGHVAYEIRASVGSGQTATIEARLQPIVVVATAPAPSPPRRSLRAPAWALGAAGVVFLGIGAGLLGHYQATYDSLSGSCSPGCAPSAWADLPPYRQSGWALVGVGSALAVATVALVAVELRRRR